MPRPLAMALALQLCVPAFAAEPPPVPPAATPAPPSAPTAPPKPTPLDPHGNLNTAKPGVVYLATSAKSALDDTGQESGTLLKYTYVLPQGFLPNKPRDMVIIIHGYGLDCTWGSRANPPASFCTDDIVISVDGTREGERGAMFPGSDGPDVLAMRDFVLEMTRTFPTGRIIIYGHSQGAFLALAFGNQFPRLINGVVAHSGGLKDKMHLGGLKAVPTVLLHGTSDNLVPYRLSVDARDILADNDAVIAHLRRVYGHTHEPNPAEVDAAVAFCIAMSTDKADVALTNIRRLLRPIGPNAPAFNLALPALKRFDIDIEDKNAWPRGFKEPLDEQKDAAKRYLLAIEAQGLRQVAALRTQLPNADALRAANFEPDHPAPNWLGHLLALREDFRGVECVEAFLRDLNFAEALTEHEAAAKPILHALESPDWGGTGALPKEAFVIVTDGLQKSYLYEPMPANLAAAMADWYKRGDEIHLTQAQLQEYPVLTRYLSALDKGRAAYRAINAQWETPK